MFRLLQYAVIALSLATTPMFAQTAAATASRTTTTTVDPIARKAAIDDAISGIDVALNQTRPVNNTPANVAEWNAETKWLVTTRAQLTTFSARFGKGFTPTGVGADKSAVDTGKKLTPAEVAQVNAQFLAVLKPVIDEGERRSQTLSMASKTRHEIAMSSIRNLR